MNNTIKIVQEEWDSELDFYRPSGVLPDWNEQPEHLRFPPNLGPHLLKTVNKVDLRKFIHRDIENSEYVSKKEVVGKTQYLYLIDVYEPLYFLRNKDVGFKCIDESILQDIRDKKCKLVICQDIEGYSGVLGSGSTNDFKIIHTWATAVSIKPEDIIYINGNLISETIAKKQESAISVEPVTVQECWNNVFNFPNPALKYEPEENRYLFLNYSRRPRTHRIYIGAKLLKEGLFDKGLNSFNGLYPPNMKEINSMDDTLTPFVEELYSKSPLLIDRDNTTDDITVHVPLNDYRTTFINIVTETQYCTDTLFISEKTWKPIIVGVPFIIVGSPGVLKWLHSQGFKTFDKWIDESYDLETNHQQRFDKIIMELKKLSKKSTSELKVMREEMTYTCTYNKNLMKERTRSKFYSNTDEYIHQKPTSDVLQKIWNKFTKNVGNTV